MKLTNDRIKEIEKEMAGPAYPEWACNEDEAMHLATELLAEHKEQERKIERLEGERDQAYLAGHLARPGAIPEDVMTAALSVCAVQEAETRADAAEKALKAETARLDYILSYCEIADVGDVDVVMGVIGRWEDLEHALTGNEAATIREYLTRAILDGEGE